MLRAEKIKTCRDIAWDYALTSQMNVLYYQRKVAQWTMWDAFIRVASGIAASATVITFLKTDDVIGTVVATVLGVVATLGSVAGAALKVPDRVAALGVLLAEYTTHQGVFERLFQFECTEDTLRPALEAFSETEKRESKDHPMPDQKLLDASQDLVLKRIGAAA